MRVGDIGVPVREVAKEGSWVVTSKSLDSADFSFE